MNDWVLFDGRIFPIYIRASAVIAVSELNGPMTGLWVGPGGSGYFVVKGTLENVMKKIKKAEA